MHSSDNPAAAPSKPQAHVLLVDDNPANLLALRAILEELGQNLVEARSGEEALQRMRSNEFAVVLLDVMMPGITGFETAKLIREHSSSQHTPIIFLTANDADRAQLDEGYSLGAVDFLVKPLLPVALRAKVAGFIDLFEQKQLAKQEGEQLRLLVQGTTEYAIFMLDPDGFILTWNAGAERLKGYTAAEIIGQHFSRFYPQEAIERGWPQHELDVARAVGRFEDEGWRIRKDGTQFVANVVITALHDQTGVLRGFSKITRDISARKRAEEDARRLIEEQVARRVAEENAELLQHQRERLRVTLSSIGDAVISTDAEGRVTFLNPVAEQLVGWKTEEAANQSLSAVFRIIDEHTRQAFENPAMQALREGVVVGLSNHTLLVSMDGNERPIDDSAAPIRDTEGNVVGSVLVFRDISERKRSQRALLESEERLRLALDASRMGVWDWNIQTNEIDWSETLEPMHGLAPDAFGGTTAAYQQLIHPDDRAMVGEAIRQAVDTGSDLDVEFRNLWPDGGLHWIFAKGKVLVNDAGQAVRMIGLGMDITQRKRAEQTARFLADASATLATLVDFESTLQKVSSLAVPYFADWAAVDLIEEDGSLRRVAVAHADPAKISLAHDIHRRFPPDPTAPQGVWNVLLRGQAEIVPEFTEELLAKSIKDDELLSIVRELGLKSYIGVPLKIRGKTLGVISFVTAESRHRYDAADLVVALELAHRGAIALENTQLYRDLREADRRKNEFLATLAHELRNPLAPIRTSLQILKMPRIDAATAQQTRDVVERQVDHLVRLVDDLLDVSRVMRGKIELRKELVELASIVARAVETAKPLIEVQGHSLTVSLSYESLLVDADLTRLAQVVGNLLTNAAKYTEINGRISLAAERENNEVVLRIADNGIGIAPDMLPHIFDLFVQAEHGTTRSQGGLGIGLTLVKNLVEMHGGTVEAHSAGLGRGSEFVVRLPLAVKEPSEPIDIADVSEQPPLSTGHRLLVVDDNYDGATSLALMLKLQGHEVQIAHDGYSALAMAPTYRPDMIFLDIGMPGIDGYEVARQLRQMPSLTGTVLTALTGWGQLEDRRRTAEAGFDHHLVKPAEPKLLEELLTALKRPGV